MMKPQRTRPTTGAQQAAAALGERAAAGLAPDSRPLLQLSEVRYSYPTGLLALGGVDLDLRPGEIVAIVGPSGCGKSTLLSLVSGLAAPTAGQIGWNEELLRASDRGGRRLAMLFQRDTVFAWRTVEKNVQFGMECLRLPKDERDEWTTTLLRMANLEQFRKSYPRSLSGGMRRRVGLLTSLAVKPSVLLLDEPFSALDEPTRVELASDVVKLSYQQRVSVVLVTHDLGEAISIADRIIVMSNRPARVQRVFDVPFGHDRDVYSLRESAEYAELYRELWHELWEAIRADRPDQLSGAAVLPGARPVPGPGPDHRAIAREEGTDD
jgi:NitT/TauT family transport system ATP-binding protein